MIVLQIQIGDCSILYAKRDPPVASHPYALCAGAITGQFVNSPPRRTFHATHVASGEKRSENIADAPDHVWPEAASIITLNESPQASERRNRQPQPRRLLVGYKFGCQLSLFDTRRFPERHASSPPGASSYALRKKGKAPPEGRGGAFWPAAQGSRP
jgi:hypothetical protein